jgi:5-methylcytosine-specific restriction endonuclease McrBC GTP-binding regulatory subunit McrB
MEHLFNTYPHKKSISHADGINAVGKGFHTNLASMIFMELKNLQDQALKTTSDTPLPVVRESEAKAYLVDRLNSDYQLLSTPKPYVLIIDEINRGNISKVFGELITLIEEDKRIGQENELIVTLPYTAKPFGVPSNLHIIGTMNTADKSIALVDIALRRRFQFEELRADFSEMVCTELTDEMRFVIAELNRRLMAIKDRDHQIGHAFYISVKNNLEFNDVFKHKVIPLLQEFFYNDWEGLREALGDKNDNGRFIKKANLEGLQRARTKWCWYFDIDTSNTLDCFSALSQNYGFVDQSTEVTSE